MKQIPLFLLAMFTVLFPFFSGCSEVTYPEEKIVSSIQEICEQEYHIKNVEVLIKGRTVGVFLPLEKLFATDVRHLVLNGKLENLESLFEPEQKAMDQLEDVLFAISRVLLSTDKPIDFYVLKAADVKSTGLQLVLTGFVADVRRVRLWDIARSEYRKRVMHELKLNRTVLWEEPIRKLFTDIESGKQNDELISDFFFHPSPETLSPIFYDFLMGLGKKQNIKFNSVEIKSRSFMNAQALIHVKFKEQFNLRNGILADSIPYASGTEFEYLFVVQPGETSFQILQVIPLIESDGMGGMRKLPFPREFSQYQDLNLWLERFDLEEVFLGDFLAYQLNRRIQALLSADERVRLTVQQARLNFLFVGAPNGDLPASNHPHFKLAFSFLTKSMKRSPQTIHEVLGDEDVRYMLRLVLEEFRTVTQGYSFSDYESLELFWEQFSGSQFLEIPRAVLEAFFKKKISFDRLLGSS